MTVDAWDERLDGKFDKTKVVKEDFGDGAVEGIWVTRGRTGVHKGKTMQISEWKKTV